MGASRVEDILQAGLDGTELPKAVSRVEILLEEWIEQGGGGSSDAYATAISLTIDSSTYVMTAQLLNKDGDPLGTAQTIDLPLESMVVSGSYNDQTKKVILTLKNGETVEFSIADLIDGLASQSDLDALTTRVGVNENNILTVVESGGRYNVLNYATLSQAYSAAITTDKQPDYVTVTANGKFCTVSYPVALKAGEYVYQTKISDYSATGTTIVMISATSNGSTPIKTINITDNGIVHTDFTLENDTTIYLLYSPNPTSTANTTNTFKSSENEIVPKSLYDGGMTDYQPYAMTNAELTAAEKQNEADISLEQAKTTGMTEGGSNYITVGGIRVYVSATAPTGARTGDLWIGG